MKAEYPVVYRVLVWSFTNNFEHRIPVGYIIVDGLLSLPIVFSYLDPPRLVLTGQAKLNLLAKPELEMKGAK